MSISHVKASRLIQADLDGALSPADRAELEGHLAGCAACRAERQRMASIDQHLSASLRGHWPRKSITLAELDAIAAKVEAGAKGRSIFKWGTGWFGSIVQYAAIAAAMIVMAGVLGAFSGGLKFGSHSETETPSEEPAITATPILDTTVTPLTEMVSPTPGECRALAYADLDLWTGPGEDYALMGTVPAGTELRVIGRAGDTGQATWLQIVVSQFYTPGWVAWDASQGGDALVACPFLPIVDVPIPSPTPTALPPGVISTPEAAAATPTSQPLTATWTPSATPDISTTTPEDSIVVGCSRTVVYGTVSIPAPFVRATVSLASNPITQIAEAVVDVGADGHFTATLTYEAQPEGTRLIVAVGEWDGSKFLEPADLSGWDCSG